MEDGTAGQQNQRARLLEQARTASTQPGCYLMKNAQGVILYVGKAKALKNRLVTYFKGPRHESPRTEIMVQQVDRFDVILTETETEALILECHLIKKHKPKYNVRLKDDKSYPYIRVNLEETYPRLEYVRRIRKDGSRYFGPFPSAWAARQVMALLTESLQLRDCSENVFRHRSRPCILHQMGKCSAPCVELISAEDYRVRLREAMDVLEGKGGHLLEELQRNMKEAAEAEEYERAAECRDQIRNLEVVMETQSVAEAGVDRARDVVGLARKATDAHGVVLQMREGKLLAARHFHLHNTDPEQADAQVLFDFLAQYYVEQEKAAEDSSEGEAGGRPSDVLIPYVPEDARLLEKALRLEFVEGESDGEKQLLAVARSNAEYALESAVKRGSGHGLKALEEVQKKIGLEKLPHRIECYDISNIQGTDAVASRVVFVEGAPDKNLYRRYKIRTVDGSNDFAMMKEVLGRRFANESEELPDLVVVDGGKGQLSQAVAILDELNVQGVEVVGLAKARTERDFQAADVKSTDERIFKPNRVNPIPLRPNTDAYKLLVHVRDEAHRFAVSYHRQLRTKRTLKGSARGSGSKK